MFVSVQSKEGWRIRNNYKLQKLIKGGTIVKIKTNTKNEMVGTSKQNGRYKTS